MINYYLITKPKIVMGNLLTVGCGFLLASKGVLRPWLFLATLLGIALIMASSCVFNNYINRHDDKKMSRTKDRPLVTGLISGKMALLFGSILGIIGGLVLYAYTNLLTLYIAILGFFVYVVLYSFWKGKTIYGTAIGSVAGAVPPVIGYCAVSNQFDLGALVLFIMLVLWQMPHFFSIALYHFDDYKAADIPVLPIKKGFFRTKIHMALYIMGFILTAALLTHFNYTGRLTLLISTTLGALWLALSLRGFTIENHVRWGKNMFHLSLLVITILSVLIPFDLVT